MQDVTSDKMRAIMRMQFWKDAIEHIFKVRAPPDKRNNVFGGGAGRNRFF